MIISVNNKEAVSKLIETASFYLSIASEWKTGDRIEDRGSRIEFVNFLIAWSLILH